MLRLLLVMVLFTFATLGLSQHSIWIHTVSDSSNPRFARDASGNLYLATRGTTLNGRQLKLQKINALGVLVWEWKVVASSGGLDRQYNIRSVSVLPGRVMVVVQERDGAGEGALVASQAMSFLQSNGSFETSVSSSDEFVTGASGGGYFSVLRRNATTGATSVDIRSGSDFSSVANPALGNTNHAGALAMDPDGNTYVGWTSTADEAQISKFNSAGTSLFQTRVNMGSRTEEKIQTIVYDPATVRVFMMTSGRWHVAPFDLDVQVYIHNASTGALAGASNAGISTADELPGDLILARPSGVLASIYLPGVSEGRVFRIGSSGGVPIWTRISAASTNGTLSLAQDADNNALLLRTVNANLMNLDRYSLAAGAVINSYDLVGTSLASRGLFSDAAGNFFLLHHSLGGVSLRRMQPAILGAPTGAVLGGASESGWVSVMPAATVDQPWTLTSSNTSVISVPATATVPTGGSIAYFDITVHPVTATTTASINARYGGFITQRQVTVLAPALSSILVAPNTVIGGVPTTAQVILNGKAPTGGRVVTLSSNKPAVASVPANVTIAAGATTAFQAVTTFGVATNQGVVLTATLGAVSKTAFMAVNAPSLTGAFVDPGAVQGGNSATLTLEINGIAPTGGLSIVLHSGAPGIVLVPGTGAVPAGATNGNVTVNTAAVTSSTNVLIFATRAGIYRVATLTVTP